ncbi:unnamed protein product [Urochloa humidicola]
MSFAGVSLIGDGCLASGSGWDTAAADSDSGYHLLVVRGYSRTKDDTPNGKSIKSQQFRVGGYRWLIDYYPNGCEHDDIDYISFYLSLDEDDVNRHVNFKFDFSFVDQVWNQEASRIRAKRSCDDFSGGGSYWGYPCFVTRSIFERSRHLKNDSFTVRCDIVVTTDDANLNTSSHCSSWAVVSSSPPSGIQQHLGSLLLSGEGADVAFEVGGETFTAHRCVLAARSPVFRAELFGPMKEGTTASTIRIDDMEPRVFGLLLSFIYTDSMPGVDDDCYHDDDDSDDGAGVIALWQHLLVAADIYDLQKLKLICEESLCRYIEADTVASILAVAEQHNCQGLKHACLDFRDSLRKEEIRTRLLLAKIDAAFK